jgi:dsRNA-specific ribonuclease
MANTEEIYYGSRNDDFKDLISSVLSMGKLKKEYIDILLNNENMEMYSRAFTHPSANPEANYEFLEFLGDATLKKCIPWYLNERFPFLRCAKGVKIITRAKINLEQKNSFFNLATELGFWPFITASQDIRHREMKQTLEDTFEAFFGTTEMLIDNLTRQGVGYQICYNMVKSILEDKEISLKFEDLFDAKTRLKETFDYLHKQYPDKFVKKVLYIPDRKQIGNTENYVYYSSVYNDVKANKEKFLGIGSAALQADAEQKAAEIALQSLKRKGYEKPIPEIYKEVENLCKS